LPARIAANTSPTSASESPLSARAAPNTTLANP
jgi:hypothetical protein